jgi:hypothetical protein
MKTYPCALVLLAVAAALPVVPCEVRNPPGATPAWGTLKGQVVYAEEKLPTPVPLKVGGRGCKGPLFDETWVVNKKNKGVRYAFVWLEDSKGKPLPIHPDLEPIPRKAAVIGIRNCQFVPHALALREGQILVAENKTDIPHNFRCVGLLANPGGNRLMPPRSPLFINDLKADKFPMPILCDIHPWMSAWVGVFDHPYFAVTDTDGRFEMKHAPAGTYKFKVWLGGYGWMGGVKGRVGRDVTIRAGRVADVGRLKIGPRKAR